MPSLKDAATYAVCGVLGVVLLKKVFPAQSVKFGLSDGVFAKDATSGKLVFTNGTATVVSAS